MLTSSPNILVIGRHWYGNTEPPPLLHPYTLSAIKWTLYVVIIWPRRKIKISYLPTHHKATENKVVEEKIYLTA